MAKLSTQELLEQISNMTVLEISEIVKAMEEKFGITAAAPVAMAAVSGEAAAVVEEKTEFDVILKEAGAKKIEVIKEVRAITGLGLKEAKDLVEAGGKIVKAGIAKKEAQEIKQKLEAVGATIDIT